MTESAPQIGKYRILDTIGKGGFATVYRAHDTDLDRDVALKVLDPLLTRDPAWVQRFRLEARTVARLRHPRIVAIHEVGQAEGMLFLAMDLIAGGNLADHLTRTGAQPWDQVVRLVGEIAEALDYAHSQGVLHRDLKPANVLLDPQTGSVLSDFGFARLLADNALSLSLSRSGGIVGTPAYIAPEIWDGQLPTAPTDIYALGCIAYELVTGNALFGGASPLQVLKAVHQGPQLPEAWPEGTPPGLSAALAPALAADPTLRYARAGELAAALRALKVDHLAEPYAALETALARKAWGDALELAAGIRSSDDDYRDVGALEQRALAGMQQEVRQEQAALWQAEAEAALAAGDLEGAELATRQSLQLTPGDAAGLALLAQVEAARQKAQTLETLPLYESPRQADETPTNIVDAAPVSSVKMAEGIADGEGQNDEKEPSTDRQRTPLDEWYEEAERLAESDPEVALTLLNGIAAEAPNYPGLQELKRRIAAADSVVDMQADGEHHQQAIDAQTMSRPSLVESDDTGAVLALPDTDAEPERNYDEHPTLASSRAGLSRQQWGVLIVIGLIGLAILGIFLATRERQVPPAPVEAMTVVDANLYAAPDATSTILGRYPARTPLKPLGWSKSGWLGIQLPDGMVWLRAEDVYVEGTQPIISAPTPPATLAPGEKPQAGSIMISEKDDMKLAYVPAGEFLMGGIFDDSRASTNEYPSHFVHLDAFWIDRTEVTNAQYQACVSDGSCQQSGFANNSAYNGGNQPVVGVFWADAKAYCDWAGRRLPTEAEWEKAARGSDERSYPWGNLLPRSQLLNYNEEVGKSTPVGAYPPGASPYGALDMAGNAWEWVADWYSITYYASSPERNPKGPATGQEGVLRGGSWFSGPGDVRTSGRLPVSRNIRGVIADLGFRCAMSE